MNLSHEEGGGGGGKEEKEEERHYNLSCIYSVHVHVPIIR